MIFKMIELKLCFVFVLTLSWVQCKQLCDYEEEQCVTGMARQIFDKLLRGVENVTDPIDPLVITSVGGEISDLKYELTNATFTELRNCLPEEKINRAETSYDYILRCSKLVLTATATAEGYIGPIYINGSDTISITADKYVIKVQGHYGLLVSEKNQMNHFYLKDHTMDTECQGKILFKTNNAFGITKEQASLADTYMKNNSKILEKSLRYPLMQKFALTILNKIDKYLKVTPVEEIIP